MKGSSGINPIPIPSPSSSAISNLTFPHSQLVAALTLRSSGQGQDNQEIINKDPAFHPESRKARRPGQPGKDKGGKGKDKVHRKEKGP
jgi:hypothetical protein